MKKIVITIFSFFCFFNVNAQNNLGKTDDLGRIALNVYIPDQTEGLPDIAAGLLRDRMQLILTQNGLSGDDENSRFIAVPVVNVLSKTITSSIPAMTVIELQISMFIGDGIIGTKFGSISQTVKGVGQNENKAFTEAIKKIRYQDASYVKFIETSKTRIVEYYNSKCDFIIKEAQVDAEQNKFDEAIYKLYQVPEVCKACYEKCMNAVIPIYQSKIDRECQQLLSNAKSVWASGLNYDAANSVSEIISAIDPRAKCYPEVKILISDIQKRINQIDKREWDFKLKQQQDEVDIRKATIKAARDVGVAYGQHQPKVVYNVGLVRSWW